MDQNILLRVKNDIRLNKIIIIGFCERYSDNISAKLNLICVNPRYKLLLNPIIQNGCVGGEIHFELIDGKVKCVIKAIEEFDDVHNEEIELMFDLQFFDAFCNVVEDIGIFSTDNGDILLTDI